jgi:hypothetical protein
MKTIKNVINPIYGIVIKKEDGEAVLTTNTKAEKIATGDLKAGQKLAAVYEIENIFGNGKYTVSPAIANEDATIFYDWREGMLEFYVAGWDDSYASIHPPHSIVIERSKNG